jgi:ribokinase
VIGHVEWIVHAFGRLAGPDEITRLTDPIEEPAGGGAVTAAQVAKLGVECDFFTGLGADARGDAALERLRAEGITVHAARREQPQTWGLSATSEDNDRAIAIVGEPVVATVDDALPWSTLASASSCFFTGHDPAALRRARECPILVVTARRLAVLVESGVRADVIVASATDADEAFDSGELDPAPAACVWTHGADGGRVRDASGERAYAPAAVPGPILDTYGAGDSFVGGLTVGLGLGRSLDDAVALGARCGARALTYRGALSGQMKLDDAIGP